MADASATVPEILKEKIKELKEEIDEWMNRRPPQGADYEERQNFLEQKEQVLKMTGERIKKYEITLRAFNAGHEPGVCVRCGRPIPEDRLAIFPEAIVCAQNDCFLRNSSNHNKL